MKPIKEKILITFEENNVMTETPSKYKGQSNELLVHNYMEFITKTFMSEVVKIQNIEMCFKEFQLYDLVEANRNNYERIKNLSAFNNESPYIKTMNTYFETINSNSNKYFNYGCQNSTTIGEIESLFILENGDDLHKLLGGKMLFKLYSSETNMYSVIDALKYLNAKLEEPDKYKEYILTKTSSTDSSIKDFHNIFRTMNRNFENKNLNKPSSILIIESTCSVENLNEKAFQILKYYLISKYIQKYQLDQIVADNTKISIVLMITMSDFRNLDYYKNKIKEAFSWEFLELFHNPLENPEFNNTSELIEINQKDLSAISFSIYLLKDYEDVDINLIKNCNLSLQNDQSLNNVNILLKAHNKPVQDELITQNTMTSIIYMDIMEINRSNKVINLRMDRIEKTLGKILKLLPKAKAKVKDNNVVSEKINEEEDDPKAEAKVKDNNTVSEEINEEEDPKAEAKIKDNNIVSEEINEEEEDEERENEDKNESNKDK